MPIDMSGYKMIYQDLVFNVVTIIPDFDSREANQKKPKFISAIYLDECGEIAMIKDEAWMFKFVRR